MTVGGGAARLDVVDAYALSEDHDICSGRERMGQRRHDRRTLDGLLFHPNGAGERAIAKAIVDRLRDLRL